MAAPVGSSIFLTLALLTISLLVLLLLRHYIPLRTAPAYLLVPVFLALALPASIILLVPIDLASHASASSGIWLPDRALLVAWRITYWLTFLLTWAILPLLGEYSDSGYREPKDRFMYALRNNGRYQLMVLATGTLGLVYIIISQGFNLYNLKVLVMALAYTWGLILAIYLMGHGLVALPRRLWRNANVAGRLRRVQMHAPTVHEKLTEATEKLEEYEGSVVLLKQRKSGTAREFQEWIEELGDMVAISDARVESGPARVSTSRNSAKGSVPPVITERYLADLTRRLKRAKHAKMRFVDEWSRLVTNAADLQAILDSKTTKKLTFTSQPSRAALILQRSTLLNPYTRYLLHTYALPTIRYSASIFLSLASISIIWSEIIKSVTPTLSIVGLTIVRNKTPEFDNIKIGFPSQLIASAWLLYMVFCALLSISEVKVWGNRALVRRQTYPESACWYSLQVAKLTVPLAYNFITFLPVQASQVTVFYNFLGQLIDITPLGEGFSRFFPIFILVPVFATLFGLYRKVGSILGFGSNVMDDEDEENESGYGTGGWREGRTLIEHELSLRGSSGSTSASAGLLAHNTVGLPQYRDDPSPRPSASIDRPTVAPREARRVHQAYTDEDSGESNFFTDFAHRVRNTFETTERPAWLEGLRPRWMDNEGEGGSGDRSGLRGWFGGGGRSGGGGRGGGITI